MIALSIVLPCYNEGQTLRQLVQSYREALRGMDGVELILVDNGSRDTTAAELLSEQAEKNPFDFRIVTVPVNRGYGYGILQGVAAARGEYVAWSHADLQCPAEDIARLYRKVLQQPEPRRCFGKGIRTNRTGTAAFLTRMQSLLSAIILGRTLTEINAQPKLFHRDFAVEFRQAPPGYELDLYAYYCAVAMNLQIVTVDVVFHERRAGRSKWAYSICSRLRFILRNSAYLVRLRLLKKKAGTTRGRQGS